MSSANDLLADSFDRIRENVHQVADVMGVEQVWAAKGWADADDSWNPPVTLAVRLVSVISDDLQHAGQASFVHGIVERL